MNSSKNFHPFNSALHLRLAVLFAVLATPFITPLQHAEAYASLQRHSNGTYAIQATQEPVPALVSRLAQAAHINVMMDESVAGIANIRLQGVNPVEALRALCRMHGLSLHESQPGIWLITNQAAARQSGMFNQNMEMYTVKNGSAAWLASLLNRSLSGTQAQGTDTNARQLIQADERNNALIFTGAPEETAFAKKFAQALDIPRERRVYQLSYARAVEVAEQLEAAVFGNRGNAVNAGVNTQATVSVDRYRVQEGAMETTLSNEGGGGTQAGAGGAGASGGAGGTTGSGMAQSTGLQSETSVAIRRRDAEASTYNVKTLGAVVLPNSTMNTLTIVGTPYQLNQVEALLPTLDAKPAQVSIYADLIEVSSTSLNELGFSFAFSENGSPWSLSLGALAPGVVNTVGFLENATFSDTLNLQIQALMQNGKAKSIASPHIVASHDSETVINITDQILRGQQFSAAGNSQFFGQTSPLIGQAGITLDILPKIGANHSVTLRVHPVVTSVYSSAGSGSSTIQLLRSRDLAAQSVTVKDGESMVIGGLIDNRESSTMQKIPGLGDLPILGALFRASRKNSVKSELLVLITPHILNPMEPTPIHRLEAAPHRP